MGQEKAYLTRFVKYSLTHPLHTTTLEICPTQTVHCVFLQPLDHTANSQMAITKMSYSCGLLSLEVRTASNINVNPCSVRWDSALEKLRNPPTPTYKASRRGLARKPRWLEFKCRILRNCHLHVLDMPPTYPPKSGTFFFFFGPFPQ